MGRDLVNHLPADYYAEYYNFDGIGSNLVDKATRGDYNESASTGGVLGVLPGVVGLIQATEVVKLLLNLGTTLSGRLLTYDALDMSFRQFKIRRDPACAACGPNAKIDLASIPEFVCAVQTTSNRG